MTLGVLGAAYSLGQVVPKEEQRQTLKFINNFGGAYGMTASLGFMAGVAKQNGGENGEQYMTAVMRLAKDGTPLPTAEPIIAAFKYGRSFLAGDPFDIPYGVVPAPFSSREEYSIPTAMRSDDPIKFLRGKERGTKKEYSLLAPFVKDPELEDLPKSDRELQLERAKKERTKQKQKSNKELIEMLRRRRAERRNMMRAAQQE
jgi:hypothetical protein